MLCFATIVSANYIAYARVLAESVALHHPEADFKVLLVDRPTAIVKDAVRESGLDVRYAEELGLPDFESLAFKFDLVELNTALKPTFLLSLISGSYSKVVYLDPDIQLFAPILPVTDCLAHSDVVLTPHANAPALDGARPSDIDFLRNGVFNLGFVAIRDTVEARALLEWWQERCLSYGFNDLGMGLFVDQKWMDLAPIYFDGVRVLKHPGCNVAYWNLHERQLSQTSLGLTVNGHPLCFFHFSGVRADRPHVLSRHQNRHSLESHPLLGRLVSDYCAALHRMSHESYNRISYTYGQFDNGVVVPSHVRRVATFFHEPVANPFSSVGPLYRSLKKKRLLASERDLRLPVNTLQFSEDARAVKLFNILLRRAIDILGFSRVVAVTRYAAVLGREANLLRVYYSYPFDLTHAKPDDRRRTQR
jgi:hypothetical protein